MVKNERGFTIIELLAVSVVISVIVVPLMFTMIRSIEVNNILHIRRSSVSIASGTLYGFDKLDYSELESVQDLQSEHFTEYNSETCNLLDEAGADNVAICIALFDITFNSYKFDNLHFRVFVYDYNISESDRFSLTENDKLPPEVQEEIGLVPFSEEPNPGLLRITVWIQYLDDPISTTVLSGLLIGDWTSADYEE